MKSFTMFKKSDTTSDVPTSKSLFSRIKAKFSRVGRSAKVAADAGFVPETISSVKALTSETPGPVPAASEHMEVVAQPLSNAAGHTHTSITMDSEFPMLSSIPASSSWSAHPANVLKANEPFCAEEIKMVVIPSSCTALLAEEKISTSSSMSPSINDVCTFLNSLPTSCTALLGEAKIAPSSSVPADFATFVASLPSFWRALAAAQDAAVAPSSPVPASASFLASVPSSWTMLLAGDAAAATSSAMPESTSMVTTTSISASFSWHDKSEATLVPSLSSTDDMLAKFIKAMDDGNALLEPRSLVF